MALSEKGERKVSVSPFRRRGFWAITGTLIAGFLTLAAWAFASPVGSSPDDNFHLASIWCGQGTRDGLCDVEPLSATVASALLRSSDCLKNPEVPANCRTTISAEGFLGTKQVNNVTQSYPKVFYFIESFFASSHVSVSVLLMRLFNAFLALGVIFVLVKWSPPRISRSLLYVSAVALVPLGTFIIPSTNPSSWAVISAVAIVPAMLLFFESQRRSIIVLGAAVSFFLVVIGSGSRVDSAIFCIAGIFAAWLISPRGSRLNWRRGVFAVALIGLAFAMYRFGGSADNLTNQVQPDWWSNPILLYNFLNLPSLWQGAFGTWGLGWLDVKMPAVVPALAWGAFVAAVVAGIRYTWTLKNVALGALLFGSFVIPFYVVMHDSVFVGEYVQPRYVYPLLIILMATAMVSASDSDHIFTRTQLIVLSAMAAVANSVALFMTLKRYVQGSENYSLGLNTDVGWWWISGSSPWFAVASPMTIWAVGSFAFAAVLLSIVVRSSSSRRVAA